MHKSCEELNGMTVAQLLPIAKDLNIKGRHGMTRTVLINSIIQAYGRLPLTEVHGKLPLEDELAADVEAEWNDDTQASKDAYIDNAKIGMLIAFKVNDRKALSGKIEEIHGAGFVVKTKNGVKFNVRKKNVMWVKTGNRWPRGVYLALKGELSVNGQHQAAN